jgi:hypothetical protein
VDFHGAAAANGVIMSRGGSVCSAFTWGRFFSFVGLLFYFSYVDTMYANDALSESYHIMCIDHGQPARATLYNSSRSLEIALERRRDA